MTLSDQGRYAYSPITARADYDWPEGKRLGVYIAVNIEYYKFGELLGHLPANETPWPGHRDHAWRDYGNRVGVWRILKLLDELNLPAVHLTNSEIYRHHPEITDAIRARGDEVVGHGRTNSERQGILPEDEEAVLISEATLAITKAEGAPPGGWMSPWQSESLVTADLLKENGYSYTLNWPADDQPFWMTTRSGPLLSVPYPIEINDAPQMLARRHSPAEFADMIIDQFDEMLEQSVLQPLVLPISLHPMVSGQPYRIRHLRRALQHIVEHSSRDRVWLTRSGEIAKHCASLPKGIVPGS